MTDRHPFSQDEWEAIRSVPLLAGLAVARAAPSGVRGGLSELRTLIVDIGRRGPDRPATPLVDAIIDDHPRWHLSRLSGSDTADPEQLLADAVGACAGAHELLETHIEPDDVAHFREWVLSIAHHVASTCREDDAAESAAEVAAIRQLREALGGDVMPHD